jgi:hypothetical protein
LLGAHQTHACRSLSEPDEPRLGARARGEPLRAHVHGFEQIRLADPDARDQLELEFRVRPKVSKRDVGDDQPASLIGMIR